MSCLDFFDVCMLGSHNSPNGCIWVSVLYMDRLSIGPSLLNNTKLLGKTW